MADTEESYVRRSVKDLAAGLNHGEVGRVPITSKPAKPLPSVKPKFNRSITTEVPTGPTKADGLGNTPAGVKPPPPRLPTRRPTDNSVNDNTAPKLPSRTNTSSASERPPPPGLPTRRPSEASSVSSVAVSDAPSVPGLPPRRPTDPPSLSGRRKSQASVQSENSVSSGSRVKAPEYDPSKLPPLPAKRSSTQQVEEKAKSPLLPSRGNSRSPMPALPSRGPKLPDRSESTPPTQPPRRLPPREAPPVPQNGRSVAPVNGSNGFSNGTPPPVPRDSRPDLSKIMATKPKVSPSTQPALTMYGCLYCRDFSGPDNHSARFPRETVSSIDQLARDLCGPFPSPTDKARAIFTWMHHNIAYDCDVFFGNNIRSCTPMDTLRKGAGVCAGYSHLYEAIALKAGLECIVVSGHGKGYGYSPLQPGQPVPPEQGGHAWNAVKIEIGGPGGQLYWKLLDSCWGAGHLGDSQRYTKKFSAHEFIHSNETFGLTHWPTDRSQFFRADRRAVPWAEYYVGEIGEEGVETFEGGEEGIDKSSFLPKPKKLSANPAAHATTNGMIRFQFSRFCEHWKPEINGKGKDYVYAAVCGKDQRWQALDFNGMYWWIDVPVSTLGKPGEEVTIWYVDMFDNKSGRGVTKEEYMRGQGRIASSGRLVARWSIVP